MPEGTSITGLDLGKLAKPADTLIKKVSDAVGGICAPWQMKRVAKAEAEAALIRADTELQITELKRRALHRFVEEEGRRQENIENITARALPHLSDDTDASKVDDDWVTNFFDKSRIVSDAEMQELWSRVLAGEANRPGSYSKRTVNFLAGLDKRDAALFQSLCRFGWIVGTFTPLVFDGGESAVYRAAGLDFNALTHLNSIGLIQFNTVTGFVRTGLPRDFTVHYCGRPLRLTLEQEMDNRLEIGKVLLTQIGRELVPICKASGVKGFDDFVRGHWKKHLPPNDQGDSASTPG